ncbi:hyaluronate lyase N-terminal domain-containing protein [Streptococcus dysgalactiae]|uniref:hyaluronate lyase N-terminal domain-containing protein n=1 Tax=Streptococcus dysgalactiae TaxID=1334 RepID=UPI0013FD9CB2|nr:hyaluronoglucosaminidase [Streptococcus dysgalactiae]
MSKEVASARIQHRGMSTQEWEASSDILMEREIGIDTTTGYPKVGDGESRFSELKDLRGERGEKGDSITITKQLRVSDGVQITFSDETQVTIPKGEKGDSVKGDKGDSVESVRVEESGDFYVTIEGQSEKLLGNIKGGKGDKGDPLKFEDLTPEQIAQIKAKDVDLSAYATKAELAEIDVSKQLTDYLSKTEAESTYAKASHKHSLSDITDLNLDRYATKIELQNKASTYHRHRTSDIDGIDEYLKQTDLPQDMVKQSDIRDVVRNAQLSGYVRLADIQYQLNNIGKLKDETTGQYLSVRVVDNGRVPYDTTGMIVFERFGGK